MIYSGIPHTTASLFLLGKYIENHAQIYIISSHAKNCNYIKEKLSLIYEVKTRILESPEEVLAMSEFDENVIIIPEYSLRYSDNLISLERESLMKIERGSHLSQNTCIEKLISLGYEQKSHPGESGTYKREGSVIHIWKEEKEYTIEYYDEEIESIIERSPLGHKHRESVLFTRIHPRKKTTDSPDRCSFPLLETLKEKTIILIGCEFFEGRDFVHTNFRNCIEFSFLRREGSHHMNFDIPKVDDISELITLLKDETSSYSIATKYEKKIRELEDLNSLSSLSILPFHGIESFRVEKEIISEFFGKKWQETKKKQLTILSDDIFGKIFLQNRTRKTSMKHLDLLLRIAPGDLVVHREHGIGKYVQILRKQVGLVEREYMEIEYGGGDRVYVPMTELARITKYVGDSLTELTPLTGKEWERTLSKTDEEIEAIAEDILSTEAKRKLTTRIPFRSFPEEEEFRKAFHYTHTPDQISIIEGIREDMEDPHPMDRLIAGDVGFGKTEVAMNAIYKAVLSGFQVAVISPLLILAEEHRQTFEARFSPFGVRVRSLTRMTHAGEVKKILEELRDGKVDVVVGTHRLLSEDIHFRRLGLLVIDEEHRFGVVQKERIKKMKAHVDILSLSATPIPRSLHLALSGLKKISLLTTPPPSKKAIETIVSRWEDQIVKEAIHTELERGGQVIILHNRIQSLEMIAREIEELISLSTEKRKGSKGLKIAITHGQMNPDSIEDRILAFKEHKYDILITTTIIENGVNFLGANTIIVSDAEEFGLAQLHQIRGRVGRKDVQGICYLLYRKYELSGEERERLMILAEHSELGSGYEIAMRDMQMRGTGDILGWRQSGKTKEVGISLYFQMLEEKIAYMKSGKKEGESCKIDLDLSYVIPLEAFDSEADKLSFFRDIESIETLEDLEYVEATFRMSDIPESMSNLFVMLRSSLILSKYQVTRVSKVGQYYHFDFSKETRPSDLRGFLERFDSGHEMIIVSGSKIKVNINNWNSPREFLFSLS